MPNDLKKRLQSAGCKPATLTRLKELVDAARFTTPKEAKEIEEALLYLCDKGPLPDLSKEFGARVDDLTDTIAQPTKWNAWDLRVLDLITLPKVWSEQSWEFWRWARKRITNAPAAAEWEPVLTALQARGAIASAEGATLVPALATIIENVGSAFSVDSITLTSAGRWMLKHVDASLDTLIAAARSADAMDSLLGLLAYHRPAVFADNQKQLTVTSQPNLSYLIQLLLETDAAKNEAAALKLSKKITGGYQSFLVARNLFAHFKKKHATEMARLLNKSMTSVKKKDVSMMLSGENPSLRLATAQLAIKALGEEAFPILRLYDEENDAIRLGFYETCSTLGESALPLLIDGLVYPKDPNVEYGFTSHAKYVATMLKLLSPYKLSPFEDRISKAFATNPSKKIQELIGEALGKKVIVKKTALFDAKAGYQFDEYAKALAAAAIKTLVAKTVKLPKSISSLQLACMDGEMAPWMVILNEDVQIELPEVKHRLPSHVDDANDDPILKKLMAMNGTADDYDGDLPRWGDIYALPSCVLTHELIGAAQAVLEGLKKAGVAVAKNCKFGWGAGDDLWEGLPSFEKRSRKNVAALPNGHQANFAAMCFLDPKKQKWLLE